jgi:hypothetical protein
VSIQFISRKGKVLESLLLGFVTFGNIFSEKYDEIKKFWQVMRKVPSQSEYNWFSCGVNIRDSEGRSTILFKLLSCRIFPEFVGKFVNPSITNKV